MRAVVLRDNRLEVRETADPVAGPGELLIRPLSAALCASDVHYMDHHPNSAPRFVWDAGRDTIMGHEFIGEVVGHGPGGSENFPVGARVTSMPVLLGAGQPHVIRLSQAASVNPAMLAPAIKTIGASATRSYG